ncbi:MAG: AtpZ/AtpI family protein [Candidatus Puniceispirillum sp.]
MSVDNNEGDERLKDIERRINAMQQEKQKGDQPSRSALPKGMGAIMGRVATELVAGVIVGAFFGWVLDNWLGTSPLFLLVLFFLGAIAGMLNVWRIFTGRGLAAGYFDEHKQTSDIDKEQERNE